MLSLVQTQQDVEVQFFFESFLQELSNEPLEPLLLSQKASLLFIIIFASNSSLLEN